jgi:hypothetical protein
MRATTAWHPKVKPTEAKAMPPIEGAQTITQAHEKRNWVRVQLRCAPYYGMTSLELGAKLWEDKRQAAKWDIVNEKEAQRQMQLVTTALFYSGWVTPADTGGAELRRAGYTAWRMCRFVGEGEDLQMPCPITIEEAKAKGVLPKGASADDPGAPRAVSDG